VEEDESVIKVPYLLYFYMKIPSPSIVPSESIFLAVQVTAN